MNMDVTKNILIVDDEPNNTQIIKDLLEFEGYGVLTAENGREALNLLEKNSLDLVITDYEMPVMDGFELLKSVSRGYPDLPVIMLTGQYREDINKAIATLKEGAYDYLTKPADLTKLRKAVITALHISQTKRESRSLTQALEKAHAELNKKNEKLEELTRLNNDLLNIVSQDLETPLTILTGSCKMLLKEGSTGFPEKQKGTIEMIGRQGEKILGMINDLLDLARVDTDRIEINKVETYLHGLIDKCQRNLQPVAGNRGIKIALQPPLGLKPVFADEARMKQALFNLIHQAILYSERNQTIRIGIIPLPQAQTVEILFHSTRVPHGEVQNIFSGEETSLEIDKRTLYRLNLCREIIELHEGEIWLEEGIQGETMFCLKIPILFVK
jgi:signal transduction histidine kinase